MWKFEFYNKLYEIKLRRQKMKKTLCILTALVVLTLMLAACTMIDDALQLLSTPTPRPSPTAAPESSPTLDLVPDPTPESTPEAYVNTDFTPSVSVSADFIIGNIVDFGGIEWLVLDVVDGKALILSYEVIQRIPYHEENMEVTWEHSSIRQYLNEEFFTSFPEVLQRKIVETTITNNDNPLFGTSGGNNTIDKVFLLSIDEFEAYFDDDDEHRIPPNLGYTWRSWWLRSPGSLGEHAAMIGGDGRLGVGGLNVITDSGHARPVMWIIF
jgi:hypothetical protein